MQLCPSAVKAGLRSSKEPALATIIAAASIAFASAMNPSVMARMDLMTDVADDMKALGSILKGKTPFDTAVVTERGNSLALHAQKIGPMFEDQAQDPKSEALDSIWSDWDGFIADAKAMEAAALMVANAGSFEDLKPAFTELGQSCTACHKDYRIDK